jgi:G3E family GTPase
MDDSNTDSRIPVTILTGFLGAGKTTLLKRLLREDHGQRIAVIENEFGEVGIDDILLADTAGARPIVEMNNGCICCTVRDDLIRILDDLATRRASGEITFERVVIETTGLADPAPVAQTFFADERVADAYRLDGLVTLVDAVHAHRQLDTHEAAREQVGFADRLVLSKSDLVDVAAADNLRHRLRAMNPQAPILTAAFGDIAVDAVLDINGFELDAILALEPDFLNPEGHHHHHDDIGSFVYRSEQAFDQERFEQTIEQLIAEYGDDLLRYKGVMYIAGEPLRSVLQGVHSLLGTSLDTAWPFGETPASTLVFIGRDLPHAVFRERLDACLTIDSPDALLIQESIR